MAWLMLGSSLFLNVVILLFCLLMLRDKETSLRIQAGDFEKREIAWERERERLLNRAMTNHWQDYTQMTSTMGVSGLESEADGKGLSDEEELRRIGVAAGESVGLGEILAEQELFEDARILGIE